LYRECPVPEVAIEVFTLRPGPRRRVAAQPKDAEEEGFQAGFDCLFGGGIATAEKLVQQEATRGRAVPCPPCSITSLDIVYLSLSPSLHPSHDLPPSSFPHPFVHLPRSRGDVQQQ
jgi:hypothetical protein